jgi:hypothetical protein
MNSSAHGFGREEARKRGIAGVFGWSGMWDVVGSGRDRFTTEVTEFTDG